MATPQYSRVNPSSPINFATWPPFHSRWQRVRVKQGSSHPCQSRWPSPQSWPQVPISRAGKETYIGYVDMEDSHIIERSTAAWLSPLVLAYKPDGSKRMCLDYRHVNKHLAIDVYPLPCLEELVEQAVGCPYYVTFNVPKGYFRSC